MVRQWWFSNGGPTEAQRTRQRWANNALIVGVPLGQRWANGGSTEAYLWLATVGPTVHLSLVYRWATVGPTVASHRWANRGPPVASHRWPNGGPTEARRTRPQWATGGCHRWPISTRTVGPPLAHQSNAILVPGFVHCTNPTTDLPCTQLDTLSHVNYIYRQDPTHWTHCYWSHLQSVFGISSVLNLLR